MTAVPTNSLLMRSFARPFSHEKQKYRQLHFHANDNAKSDIKHFKDKHRPEEKDTVVEFSINPIGTAENSMGSYVAIAARTAKKHQLRHEVHAMGTVAEGTLGECLDTIKDCITASLNTAPRVIVNIRADVRPGDENRIQKKSSKITQILQNVGDL